jgi:site-specific DNA recombinase
MTPRHSRQRITVGYCRVSTDEQSREGVSLEAQQARIRAYALATGRELSDVIVDAGESAKTLQRPGMQRILAGVRSGEIGAVVALKLDRLTRSVRDLADLLDLFAKKDVALVLVSESIDTATAIGRMIANLMASVSQWEREAIGERTAFALEHLRHDRRPYGKTPFGYRRDGDRLIMDPVQQSALAEARRMADAGAKLREIGAMLTAQGIMPPHGGQKWYASSVRSILRSKMAVDAA